MSRCRCVHGAAQSRRKWLCGTERDVSIHWNQNYAKQTNEKFALCDWEERKRWRCRRWLGQTLIDNHVQTQFGACMLCRRRIFMCFQCAWKLDWVQIVVAVVVATLVSFFFLQFSLWRWLCRSPCILLHFTRTMCARTTSAHHNMHSATYMSHPTTQRQ